MGGGGKGGGGGGQTVQPSYTDPVNGMSFTDDNDVAWGGQGQTGAQKLNAEIAARKASEQQASDTAVASAAAKAQAAEADFQSRAAGAKNTAKGNIQAYFQNMGVDPGQYDAQINQSLAGIAEQVPDLDPAPAGKYAATLGSDLYNQVQSGRQSQALAGYNSTFSPDYSQKLLGDDLISNSVSNIVNQQLDPLSSQLDNARKRGTLNDQGYAAAVKALGDARTSATSTVTGLANNVLAKDRGDLDTYIGTGRTAAGSVPLGSQFDANTYVTGAQSQADRARNAFGGDLQNAVGSTKFSDLTSLLNAGGSVQGANDPTAANPNGAVDAQGKPIGGDLSPSFLAAQALANEKRGLGSTGEF